MKIALFAFILIAVTYLIRQYRKENSGHVRKKSNRKLLGKIREFLDHFESSEIGKYRKEMIELSAEDFAYTMKKLETGQREKLKKWSEELLLRYHLLLERYNTFLVDLRVLPWDIEDVVLAFKIAFLYYYLQDRVTANLKKSFLSLARFHKVAVSDIKYLFPVDTESKRKSLLKLLDSDSDDCEEYFQELDEETRAVMMLYLEKVKKTKKLLETEINNYEDELFEVLKQEVILQNDSKQN